MEMFQVYARITPYLHSRLGAAGKRDSRDIPARSEAHTDKPAGAGQAADSFLGNAGFATSIAASIIVPIGVSEAGLQIILLPPQSAGAILWAANETGKLYGAIQTITPSGSWVVIIRSPLTRGALSTGKTRPQNVRAAAIYALNVSIAPFISPLAIEITLPASAL